MLLALQAADGRLVVLGERGQARLEAVALGLRLGEVAAQRAGLGLGALARAALARQRGARGLELDDGLALGVQVALERLARLAQLLGGVAGDALGGHARVDEAADLGLELGEARTLPGGLGLEALAGAGLGGDAPLGLHARGALGFEHALQRAHRLAALARAALGVGTRIGERVLGDDGVDGRKGRLEAALAAGGDRAREVGDRAAPGVEGEDRARALEQRRGGREGGAPARAVGAGERRGVVGPGQRGEPVGAPAVVDDEHGRREAFALIAQPAAGHAQQRRLRGGGDVLEALDVEGGRQGRQASARIAVSASSTSVCGGLVASRMRNRSGSAAARPS